MNMSLNEVRADMTAVVWKIVVAEGARVRAGDEVAVLESMKMEIPVEAHRDGTVTKVFVHEGSSIAEGDPIVEIS